MTAIATALEPCGATFTTAAGQPVRCRRRSGHPSMTDVEFHERSSLPYAYYSHIADPLDWDCDDTTSSNFTMWLDPWTPGG